MAASNPIVPKNSYNNVKVSYLTPGDATDKTIEVANNATYPAAGSVYATFDGINGKIESKFLTDNDTYYQAKNFAGTATDIIKLDTDDVLRFNKAVMKSVAWTPSFVAVGGMSATGTINYARYVDCGELIHCFVHITGITTSGSASDSIGFTLPFTSKNFGFDQHGGGATVTDTGSTTGIFVALNNSTTVVAQKYDKGSFGLGSGRAVVGNFSFLRA